MLKKYWNLFYRKYLEPFDPYGLLLQKSLKVSISVSVCAFFVVVILKKPQDIATWPILASLFVSQMYLGETIKQRIFTQVIGAIIGAIAVFVASWFSQYFLIYLSIMMFCTLIAFYFLRYGLDKFLPALFIVLLVLFAGGQKTIEFTIVWHRVIGFVLGALWAIIIANIIYPYNPKKILERSIKLTFEKLGFYLTVVINNSLRGNFQRVQIFELKNYILETLQDSRKIAAKHGNEWQKNILLMQTRMFAELVALGDLLTKPNSEYTLDILGVAVNDFHEIAKCIKNLPDNFCGEFYNNFNAHTDRIKKTLSLEVSGQLILGDFDSLQFLLRDLQATITAIYEFKKLAA